MKSILIASFVAMCLTLNLYVYTIGAKTSKQKTAQTEYKSPAKVKSEQ